MSPVSEPYQRHVPAWKKLGLKLKFAKEEPEDTQPRQNGNINLKKRKAPAEEEAVTEGTPVEKERSAKKVKRSKSKAEETGEAVNGNGTSHGPQDDNKPKERIKKSKSSIGESGGAANGTPSPSNEPADAERPSKKAKKSTVKMDSSTTSINSKSTGTYEQVPSPQPALKTPTSKGKSVSFTPDTKTKDGDSVKSLYKTWIAKQIATDPSFDPSTVGPALRSIVPSTAASPDSPSVITSTSTPASTPTTKPNNKKPTKKTKTRLPKTSSGPNPSRFDPVLTYLTTHHTSPQTWKFSKPHQNQILKHLFSLTHIPSSYDAALLPYIRGLKGTSARSRVRKDALAVREDDETWLASEPSETEKMENETTAQCNLRRRRDYEAAVARTKQILKEKEYEREDRDWELLGGKAGDELRFRKRKRAEIVLWSVGEDAEVAEPTAPTLPNTVRDDPGRHMESGISQLMQAARDPGPAPRVGRGVGMGMGGVEVIDAGGIAKASRGKKVVFGDDGAAQADGTSMVNGHGGFNGASGVQNVKTPGFGIGANGIKPKRKRKPKKRTGVPDDDDSSSSESSSSDSSDEEHSQPQKAAKKAGAEDSESSSGTSSSGDSDSD